MIKWLCMIFICVPRILYSDIVIFFMRMNKKKYSLQQRYDVLRKSAIWVNKATRRQFFIENENIISKPHTQGRVYVSNHFHVFEILALIELSPKPLIFISKKENKFVPFLANHMFAVDTLCIDRQNVRQSLKVCREAGIKAKEGYDIVIFAEGTRSKNGNVAPFKAALPTIIHYSETETVLICMYNTTAPLSWKWITYPKEPVYIKFFEPLPYSFYLENRHTFNEVTHDMIQNRLDQYKKENPL